MRQFVKLVAAALLLGFTPSAGAAQKALMPTTNSATKDAHTVARQIIELSGGKENMEKSLTALAPTIPPSFLNALIADPNAATILDAIDERYEGGRQAFSEEFSRRFTARFRERYDDLLDATAQEYADAIELPHLIEIRDFMASPAGRALAKAQSEILGKMQARGMELGKQLGRAVGIELATELLNSTADESKKP